MVQLPRKLRYNKTRTGLAHGFVVSSGCGRLAHLRCLNWRVSPLWGRISKVQHNTVLIVLAVIQERFAHRIVEWMLSRSIQRQQSTLLTVGVSSGRHRRTPASSSIVRDELGLGLAHQRPNQSTCGWRSSNSPTLHQRGKLKWKNGPDRDRTHYHRNLSLRDWQGDSTHLACVNVSAAGLMESKWR